MSSKLPKVYEAAMKSSLKLPAFRPELNRYHAWDHSSRKWGNCQIYSGTALHKFEDQLEFLQNRLKSKAKAAARQYRSTQYIMPRAYPSRGQWSQIPDSLKKTLRTALTLHVVMGVDERGQINTVYFPFYDGESQFLSAIGYEAQSLHHTFSFTKPKWGLNSSLNRNESESQFLSAIGYEAQRLHHTFSFPKPKWGLNSSLNRNESDTSRRCIHSFQN
jgi:hypothetical protein